MNSSSTSISMTESLLKRRGQGLQNQQQYIAALHPPTVDKTTAMIPTKRERISYASGHPHRTNSPFKKPLDRQASDLNYPKTKKQKTTGQFTVVSDQSNVGYVLGIEAFTELEIHGDVGGASTGSSTLELAVETLRLDQILIWFNSSNMANLLKIQPKLFPKNPMI
ncbi:hypothetical protein LIER_23665 [Lithospermum erythrorhizon]|uniref:Uncharacterized protein n=1 Tax=Lithospermum erythrorhizon TaxID=34254 RepID=A0AAV3R2H8_LITER